MWWYQRLCNAILTSWWWAHVLETCRGMKWTYCKILCIKLVNYWDKYAEMHNQQNVKKSTKSCFIISSLYASTCFEHYVLIIRRSKLYYTASGIVTPVGGRPVSSLSTYAADGHLQVWRYQMLFNTILTSWWWAYSSRNMQRHIINKLIIKQEFVH